MIQGEEISDKAEGVPVHMNATNLEKLIEPLGGRTVAEAIDNNLRAAEEQARQTGREILVHLNHPNFGYAITAEDLAAVIRERFVEVYNGHGSVNHLGDAATCQRRADLGYREHHSRRPARRATAVRRGNR